MLIHEVMVARPAVLQQSELARRIMSSHTSPEDAGRIWTQFPGIRERVEGIREE